MTEITIKPTRGEPITLTWGKNYNYKRVPGSVTIAIGAVGGASAQGCGSIGAEFDICPDGSIQMRSVGAGDGNSYMHVVTADGAPTASQIAALKARPYGAGAGRSVIAWASGEGAAKQAERYHD